MERHRSKEKLIWLVEDEDVPEKSDGLSTDLLIRIPRGTVGRIGQVTIGLTAAVLRKKVGVIGESDGFRGRIARARIGRPALTEVSRKGGTFRVIAVAKRRRLPHPRNLATISLAEFDAESRFRALAARGSAEEGIALLDKLDKAFDSRQ